jgi:hypothetical protein
MARLMLQLFNSFLDDTNSATETKKQNKMATTPSHNFPNIKRFSIIHNDC